MSSSEENEPKLNPGIFRQALSEPYRAGRFMRAARDYSALGIDCFNSCVDPDNNFEQDTLRGMEKRCMDGCLTVQLQMFTTYGTQFSQ